MFDNLVKTLRYGPDKLALKKRMLEACIPDLNTRWPADDSENFPGLDRDQSNLLRDLNIASRQPGFTLEQQLEFDRLSHQVTAKLLETAR